MCLQLCKAAYFTNNTSLWNYVSFQISSECSHSYMEKKEERNYFLSVLKDLPLPSPPWLLPCREQAVHATRVSENVKGACDSTFNVCCFSVPSSVFVSWGCTQAKPRKDFEQPSENPPPLCPGSWSCGTMRRKKKSTMGLLLKGMLLAWTHVSMDDRDEKKRQTSISVILISTNADIHKDLISIDWGATSNSGGVRGRGSCTALLTALAPPQCSYSELRNIVVAPGLVGLLCCCITTIGLHSMPCRGNTQGPIFSEVAIEDLTLWTVLKCQKEMRSWQIHSFPIIWVFSSCTGSHMPDCHR